jgi:hypothetical protein
MNIDLLKDNPSWKTCFYVAAPVFFIVMISVLLLKYRRRLHGRLSGRLHGYWEKDFDRTTTADISAPHGVQDNMC